MLPEQRKQPASCRVPVCVKESVKSHIKSKFQTVPSHYCRHTSSKQYLPEGLSLSEMYRMYENECREQNVTPAKKGIYFHIFKTDFNLGFHRPKKDLCDFCEKYTRSNEHEKNELKEKMEEHLKSKTTCRQIKEQEKLRAQTDRNVNVACFDLQQVLTTPHSMSSQLYYRRKLATFNLTGFDMGNKRGHCYMWHEGVVIHLWL